MNKQTVLFEDLGAMSYKDAWDYQTVLHKQLVANKLAHREEVPGAYPQSHYLILVEHPPVYTLGKSGSESNLLLDEAALQARGIAYYPINRGGDITYHGPGQIVGYPILDLDCFFTDVHRYVRNLEEVIIRTLADFGIQGLRAEKYTGVWVQGVPDWADSNDPFWQKNRKICAIGVHLSRWVTLHGWAFNVNTDLAYFDYIVPCGIRDEDKTVTSMARELNRPLGLPAVKNHIRRHFAEVFACDIHEEHEKRHSLSES